MGIYRPFRVFFPRMTGYLSIHCCYNYYATVVYLYLPQYLQQIKKIMKTTAKLLMSTILLAGLATGAKAQSTALASTTATLITPISISKDVDMNFGQIASSAAQGTVVLNYLDQGTISGGLTSPDGGATAKTVPFRLQFQRRFY
jgi:hypothetical protein